MDDQRIKLILELAGVGDVAELRARLDDLNTAGGAAAKGLGQVEEQLREETAAIAEAVRQQRELKAATDACAKADADLNRVLRDDAASELRAKLAALDAEAGDVADAFAKGDISARMFARDMDLIGDEAAQLKGQLAGLEQAARSEATATDKAAAAKDRLGKAAKQAGQGMAGFGQSALQTGRIVQDFAQGGIGGVLNNIEGMTQALGLGSGLAGVLTIVGVAAFAAGPKIKEFLASFGGTSEAIDRIEALKKKVKELEDNPGRLAVDTLELDNARRKLDELTRAQATWKAQQENQNAGEAASGKAIQEAIDESPTGAAGVADKARALLATRAEANSIPLREAKTRKDEAEADLKRAEEAGKAATTPEDLAGAAGAAAQAQREIAAAEESARKIKTQIPKDAQDTYAAMLNGAVKGHGPAQKADNAKLAKLLRDVDEPGIAIGVEAADPVQMQKDARFIERQQHQAQLDQALRAKRLEGQKQQVDDLSKSDALQPDAQGFAKAANADGAAAEDAFEAVRKQVTATILAKLKAKGLGADGIDRIADEAAEKVAGEAAEGIAKKAFDKVGRNASRTEAAEGKGELAAILATGQLAPPPVRVEAVAPPPVRVEGKAGKPVVVAGRAGPPVRVEGVAGKPVVVNGVAGPAAPRAPKARKSPKPKPAPKAKVAPPARRPRGARAGAVAPEKEAPPKADRLEDLARTLVDRAKGQGLDPEATLKSVKDGITAALMEALKDRKVDAPDRAKVSEKAQDIAEKAVSPKGFVTPATDAEADKIERVLGKQRQAEYEANLANDARIRANGGPVAQNPQQEKQLQRMGVEYALPPGVLERRMRGQMAREFQQDRHATPAAAQEAAKRIGDRGNEDLARRAADFGAQGLDAQQATLMLTRQLVTAYQNMSAALRETKEEARRQARDIRATSQTNRKVIH